MTINFEYLAEPKLQFGDYFEHEDTKTGLAEFGPFGKNVVGLHPSEIRLGFVGTPETISGAKEWIDECGSAIESENIKVIRDSIAASNVPSLFDDDSTVEPLDENSFKRLYKILNRDFHD